MEIRRDLDGCHQTTRTIADRLAGKPSGQPPMLELGGERDPVIRVGPESKQRALLLLDSLFHALAARGHGPLLVRDRETRRYQLQVLVYGEAIGISLIEELGHRPRKLTRAEERRKQAYPWLLVRDYDIYPSGELVLHFRRGYYGVSQRSDGKRTLEQKLGRIIIDFESKAERIRADREADRLAAEAAELERRRVEAERRQREHMTAITSDLRAMTATWHEAAAIRAFLLEYEARLPAELKSEAVSEWLAWARAFADTLDPLVALERVAKRMTPSPDDRGR